ncbi:MAG: DedA family protein [Ardenticatenaceae bacterium]
MEFIGELIELTLHFDEHLQGIIQAYGTWTYALLFLIIFLETGVVVTPFLPGDSLLFVAGTFAGTGALNVWLLFALLFAAAVLGDTLNYWIGHKIGPKVFERESRFIKQEYLERTERFYEKHGGKAIVLARFVPIVRTFAPFVAGVGRMSYGRFLFFNLFGGFIWTALFIFGGYFFGNLPIVQEYFHLLIPAIIVISVLPMVYEYISHRTRSTPAPPSRVMD